MGRRTQAMDLMPTLNKLQKQKITSAETVQKFVNGVITGQLTIQDIMDTLWGMDIPVEKLDVFSRIMNELEEKEESINEKQKHAIIG